MYDSQPTQDNRPVSRNAVKFVCKSECREQLAPYDRKKVQVLCRYRFTSAVGFHYFDNIMLLADGRCITGHASTQNTAFDLSKCPEFKLDRYARDTWMIVEFEVCLYSDFDNQADSRRDPNLDDNFGICNARLLKVQRSPVVRFSTGKVRDLRKLAERNDHAGDTTVSIEVVHPVKKIAN